ncbi:hypothetical protein DdX_18381 [Ditylenchus destructor]|uniref:Uncharacterized protein n=1 Tax=Ditylenchus destructor TaxID=166010 RepID=A0AAD4QY53_9BILA|nr:hypothetical protein DdX_18381 [Ditylenchus destructor]
MEEDLDPVMKAKFNEKLSDFIAQKRFICLPNEATYNSILATLIKFRNGSKLEHNSNEYNFVRRYSMAISNGEEMLFRGNQKVKTDPRNLLGVVMEEEDGFYRIGTDHGILSQQYSRNQIEPSSSQFVSKENVPDKEISLRTAVGADSLSGGQGYKHCNCLQGCKTGKCNCRSLGRLCNSRCHNSTSCKNK